MLILQKPNAAARIELIPLKDHVRSAKRVMVADQGRRYLIKKCTSEICFHDVYTHVVTSPDNLEMHPGQSGVIQAFSLLTGYEFPSLGDGQNLPTGVPTSPLLRSVRSTPASALSGSLQAPGNARLENWRQNIQLTVDPNEIAPEAPHEPEQDENKPLVRRRLVLTDSDSDSDDGIPRRVVAVSPTRANPAIANSGNLSLEAPIDSVTASDDHETTTKEQPEQSMVAFSELSTSASMYHSTPRGLVKASETGSRRPTNIFAALDLDTSSSGSTLSAKQPHADSVVERVLAASKSVPEDQGLGWTTVNTKRQIAHDIQPLPSLVPHHKQSVKTYGTRPFEAANETGITQPPSASGSYRVPNSRNRIKAEPRRTTRPLERLVDFDNGNSKETSIRPPPGFEFRETNSPSNIDWEIVDNTCDLLGTPNDLLDSPVIENGQPWNMLQSDVRASTAPSDVGSQISHSGSGVNYINRSNPRRNVRGMAEDAVRRLREGSMVEVGQHDTQPRASRQTREESSAGNSAGIAAKDAAPNYRFHDTMNQGAKRPAGKGDKGRETKQQKDERIRKAKEELGLMPARLELRPISKEQLSEPISKKKQQILGTAGRIDKVRFKASGG